MIAYRYCGRVRVSRENRHSTPILYKSAQVRRLVVRTRLRLLKFEFDISGVDLSTSCRALLDSIEP
jgi:hypothetical protein